MFQIMRATLLQALLVTALAQSASAQSSQDLPLKNDPQISEMVMENQTIGGMRKACILALSSEPLLSKDAFEAGICIGWILGESQWREGMCVQSAHPKWVTITNVLAARKTAGFNYVVLMNAFIDWADSNKSRWSDTLASLSANGEFWSQYKCKESLDPF